MTDIQNLYADADKPNWAGGVYSPEMLDDGRKYDLRILSKRSNSRDLEITLPSQCPKAHALLERWRETVGRILISIAPALNFH